MKYTVRISLHNIEEDNNAYEVLHENMENRKFHRYIKSTNGKVYNLPNGEYSYSGSENIDDVLKSASEAAKKTRHKYSVLVTQMAKRKWLNLEPQDFNDDFDILSEEDFT